MVSGKAVRQALYNKLNVSSVTSKLASGSASLFHSMAPMSAVYPLVVYNRQASNPTVMFGGDHIDADVWLIKAIVKDGSSSVAEDVDAAIAAVLHFKSLSISGAENLYLAREGLVDITELISGSQYRQVGHLYRLIYQ